MIEVRPRSANQLALGFGLGAIVTAMLMSVATALAQTPAPVPAPDASQMLEWCRQMMASVNPQAMIEACRATMGGMMSSMQGMMGGMCMMGR